MKKFITAILAILYIATSAGATVHMHYCMGKQADWGLKYNNSKTCPKCGMEQSENEDNGCCRDEHRFYKNDADQQVTESTLPFQQMLVALPVSFTELNSPDFPFVTEVNPTSHPPPRSSGVAVYIRNCIFRI